MATDHDLNLTLRVFDEGSSKLAAFAAKLGAMQKAGAKFALPIVQGVAGVGSALGRVGSEALGLGLRFAGLAAGAGFALWRIVDGAVEAGDKLGEMADRVGLGVDAFASLQYAAAQADVDQEQFNTALDQFNKRLGEAKAGGGGLLTFLNKVSPALAEQVKHATSTEEGLSLMTDAFKRIEDPGKRAALAAAAFGRSGLQMGNFLHQGSAAIQEQQRRFLELAGSQERFARGAGELDNTMRDASVAFLGLRNAAAGALFPAITKLTAGVTDFLAKNRDGIVRWAENAGAAISRWVDGGGLQRLGSSLESLVGSVVRFVDAVGGIQNVAIGAGLVMAGPLLSSVVGLGSALWTLGAAVVPPLVAGIGSLAVALVPAALNFAALALAAGPFLIIAGSIALVGKTIYDNWGNLKMIFSDLVAEVERLGGVLNIIKNPLSAVVSAAGFVRRGFGGEGDPNSGLTPEARARAARFNAAGAAPFNAEAARPALSSTNDARVSVSFDNLPRGARVTTDPASTAPVSTDVGYSMAVP